MYCTPWARLMKPITPKTSVSPAATRKSRTPNCRPFRACTSRSWVVTRRSAHAALGRVRIDVVFQHLAHGLGLELAVGPLDHLAQPEVLHRVVVHAEAEIAANGAEVRGLDRAAQRLLVRKAPSGLADRAVDQHGRIVALRGVAARDVVVGGLEVR